MARQDCSSNQEHVFLLLATPTFPDSQWAKTVWLAPQHACSPVQTLLRTQTPLLLCATGSGHPSSVGVTGGGLDTYVRSMLIETDELIPACMYLQLGSTGDQSRGGIRGILEYV